MAVHPTDIQALPLPISPRSHHLLFILPFPFLFRERYLTRRTGGTFYYYEEYIDECIALLLGIQERINHMGLF